METTCRALGQGFGLGQRCWAPEQLWEGVWLLDHSPSATQGMLPSGASYGAHGERKSLGEVDV